MNSLSRFRSWYDAGKPVLLARSMAMGFAAGLASWLLLYGLHLVAGTPTPSAAELVLAVVLGSLFGAILAVILGKVWDRRSGTGGQSGGPGSPTTRGRGQ